MWAQEATNDYGITAARANAALLVCIFLVACLPDPVVPVVVFSTFVLRVVAALTNQEALLCVTQS